jgi:hypothetical protein
VWQLAEKALGTTFLGNKASALKDAKLQSSRRHAVEAYRRLLDANKAGASLRWSVCWTAQSAKWPR